MRLRDFLEKWGLTSLKINVGFLEGEFSPKDPDRNAAWELYVELLTRVSTQHLLPDSGDEKTALASVHQLFPITREILRRHGSGTVGFTCIAIPILNQVVRPFTTKWHRVELEKGFSSAEICAQFRKELAPLQLTLRAYTRALAAIAAVEDLTDLEAID